MRAATRVSFDRLDSDGCMSTNDTVLLLASGASGAIVEGPGNAKQCLCMPKEPMPPQLQGACGPNWQKDHAKTGSCQSADKWGSIPIEWMGGQLTFKKGPAAQVEVK